YQSLIRIPAPRNTIGSIALSLLVSAIGEATDRSITSSRRSDQAHKNTYADCNCEDAPIMRFGIFGAAQAGSPRPGTPMGQGFHDFIDFNVEAEALGYHSTFLVEHHFTGWHQVSATLTLLTWLAARTRTLRLGTAVMVLPRHNPVILAEQAATLDLMSDGRLDFGVGKGYRHSEFKGFAVALEEADARFEEALDVILRAWTSEQRFSHRGRYWQFDDIVVEPPTRQRPHPPIWMAAGSAPSIRK